MVRIVCGVIAMERREGNLACWIDLYHQPSVRNDIQPLFFCHFLNEGTITILSVLCGETLFNTV